MMALFSPLLFLNFISILILWACCALPERTCISSLLFSTHENHRNRRSFGYIYILKMMALVLLLPFCFGGWGRHCWYCWWHCVVNGLSCQWWSFWRWSWSGSQTSLLKTILFPVLLIVTQKNIAWLAISFCPPEWSDNKHWQGQGLKSIKHCEGPHHDLPFLTLKTSFIFHKSRRRPHAAVPSASANQSCQIFL